jgi:predicted transcriptional regulator
MLGNVKDNDIFRTIFSKKIMTIDDLSTLLNSSVKTARRRLKLWKAYTSYNENARYYTFPGIPEFDAHGLWFYNQVRFSRYGNLKNTIIHLVKQSQCGLDAAELADMLGMPVRSLLTSLQRHPDVKREKIQGRFVYFSAVKKDYTNQQDYRIAMTRSIQLPSDSEAIAILVETIKHPHLSVEELSLALRDKHDKITPRSIHNLFNYHGLTRKKTPNLSS